MNNSDLIICILVIDTFMIAFVFAGWLADNTPRVRPGLPSMQNPPPPPPRPTQPKRYPMGNDQPVQLDCRIDDCVFYRGGGQCSNVAPAITLNANRTFNCWSKINTASIGDFEKTRPESRTVNER